ncbi:tryptophan synthase beta subunit-like PLP-dependent enzyme [Thamnocephalis sphaerospora]|uniref:Tryptophan synthase beta subunit-like PLP-dependent enzyme n=1 Tax=Thamnocephalis sphaerospora TaxID=78915 RepID=A0A4P9XYA6_9FUNG|nr:tryptophan synthase beta subunit-like PLP-dependent enzyme [Thamnocephalis sphaerospora]|eukprot:RKP11082.1 tryptophan synthase beta subunit-like PLP-dependent enzyme [Thamnocephalis sphaerospora]
MSFVGNTPSVVLRLPGTQEQTLEVAAKLEYRNATGSIKDRVADWYIGDLKAKGHLVPAIALAARSHSEGFNVIAVVPESTSFDRIRLLKAQGVEIVRTPAGVRSTSDESRHAVARRIASGLAKAIVIDESTESLWPADCYASLASEIVQDSGDHLDVLVVGVESGGAIAGLGSHLRKRYPALKVVGVLPNGANIHGETDAPLRREWKVEDIGADSSTTHIGAAEVDAWIHVSDRDAYSTARHLIRDFGALPGPSGGAAIFAARAYAQQAGLASARIVAVINDSATAYQSTLLNDDWLLDQDLADADLLRDIQHDLLEKYRGASVEDLQLPAAVTVRGSSSVADALDIMIEREFSQLPVIDTHRKMIGFVYDADLRASVDGNRATAGEPVERYMHRFHTGRGERRLYQVITPDTSLAELARFFEKHSAAFVTDADRRWCLAVVTKHDLIRFMTSRRQF